MLRRVKGEESCLWWDLSSDRIAMDGGRGMDGIAREEGKDLIG